jgi:hypothetical protein
VPDHVGQATNHEQRSSTKRERGNAVAWARLTGDPDGGREEESAKKEDAEIENGMPGRENDSSILSWLWAPPGQVDVRQDQQTEQAGFKIERRKAPGERALRGLTMAGDLSCLKLDCDAPS